MAGGRIYPGRAVLRALAAGAVAFAVGETLDRAYHLFERSARKTSFEVYVVGESTARGEPYGEKSAPAALIADQFGGRIGGRDIRIITVAASGQSIYPQSVALERRLQSRDRRQPGVILIYSGHNDAGGRRDSPPAYDRLRRAATRRSALLRDLWYFLEKKYPPLRPRTMESWDYHLRRVIEMGLESGLTPILATLVSNVADIDPDLPIDGVDQGEARRVLEGGDLLEAGRRREEAIRHYERACERHPRLRLYLKYRIARCQQALKRYALAKRLYQEVVDSGGWGNFGRATSPQNETIRALAKEYSVPVADVERLFAARSPHGLLGDSLFSDGQHPNIEGYRLLASAYAGEISKAFREPIRRPLAGESNGMRLGRRELSQALVWSGRWLFSVASRQTYPQQRLAMARARFNSAHELEPDNFSAWMGLQLTDLARRSALLRDQEGLDWLGRHDLFYGKDYRLSCDQLAWITGEYDKAARIADLRRRCLSQIRQARAGFIGRQIRSRQPDAEGLQ